MKLTESTIDLLKNFSSINQSIVFNPGKKFSTVSALKTVFATAEITEDFGQKFAIYDLPRFIQTLGLFNDPELDLQEKYVRIRDEGKTRTDYYYTDSSMVVSPPEKGITLPDADVDFDLSAEAIESLMRAGSVLQCPEILLRGANGVISIEAVDSKQKGGGDTFYLEVGETDHEFMVYIAIDKMKLLNLDYNVRLGSMPNGACLAQFKSDVVDYVVAAEANSTFKG